MSHIIVENLKKEFSIPKREKGFKGALKSIIMRKHENLKALDGISFSIKRGELVGYIGPNGAGKSTTVKILSGILLPSSGNCMVNGIIPWKERIRHVSRIGVVFGQKTQLWWDLPVIESFNLLKDIYRIEKAIYHQSFEELCTILEITHLLKTPVRLLSLGQRMRCELAASLLHRPDILFLDEPTIGLDAVSKLAVRKFIKDINTQRNVTVLLTTHNMDDIEAICNRIIVINKGKLFMDGTLGDLRNRITDDRRLIVDLADPNDRIKEDYVRIISRNGGRFVLEFKPSDISAADLIKNITTNHTIVDLFLESTPVEEIVAQLYKENER
ncbi:MAG: ATP-binding cassette domain-containing protein [Spirochaetales bacterium]|nr:ATP-binding cassette domain-containing protein [Spirochaetales bacterium]